MAQIIQYCTFRLDQALVGVDVLEVQEVLKSQAMTPVPKAPAEVVGLINLRGQIVTAIDLKRKLGMETCCGPESLNVIVRTETGPVSLLVDAVGDVIELLDDNLESIPDTIRGSARGFFEGVQKLEGDLMAVLDVSALAGGEV